jgi:hypothetical protein
MLTRNGRLYPDEVALVERLPAESWREIEEEYL